MDTKAQYSRVTRIYHAYRKRRRDYLYERQERKRGLTKRLLSPGKSLSQAVYRIHTDPIRCQVVNIFIHFEHRANHEYNDHMKLIGSGSRRSIQVATPLTA